MGHDRLRPSYNFEVITIFEGVCLYFCKIWLTYTFIDNRYSFEVYRHTVYTFIWPQFESLVTSDKKLWLVHVFNINGCTRLRMTEVPLVRCECALILVYNLCCPRGLDFFYFTIIFNRSVVTLIPFFTIVYHTFDPCDIRMLHLLVLCLRWSSVCHLQS